MFYSIIRLFLEENSITSLFIVILCYVLFCLIGLFVVVACNLCNNIVKNNMFNMQSLKIFKTLKNITTDSEPKANSMRWTDHIDDFLLNVMLKEQSNGNRPNQT